MSDIGKNALKTKIDAKIYDNESQLISGTILNEVLQDAVDTLADGGNLDEGSVDTANLKDEAVTKGKLAQNVSADLDWAVASNSYYRNSQAGNVAAKEITTYKNMSLIGGGSLKVTFEQANTADDATLNIDGKGAKPLYYNGKRVSSTNSWEANETVEIYYNNYNSGIYYAKRWMVEPVSVSQNTLSIGGNYAGEMSTTYDVTLHSGQTFASLSALLSDANLDTLIPLAVRKGGMSIKFVQTSDNKYVQYRLMADSFSTTEADWQGVDDEPTAESDNLVKSGGVYPIQKYLFGYNESFESFAGRYSSYDITLNAGVYSIKNTTGSNIELRDAENVRVVLISASWSNWTDCIITDEQAAVITQVGGMYGAGFLYIKTKTPQSEQINATIAESNSNTNVLNSIIKLTNDFELGSVNTSTGEEFDATNRIRCSYVVNKNQGIKIKNLYSEQLNLAIIEYNPNYVGYYDTGFTTIASGSELNIMNDGFTLFKIVVYDVGSDFIGLANKYLLVYSVESENIESRVRNLEIAEETDNTVPAYSENLFNGVYTYGKTYNSNGELINEPYYAITERINIKGHDGEYLAVNKGLSIPSAGYWIFEDANGNITAIKPEYRRCIIPNNSVFVIVSIHCENASIVDVKNVQINFGEVANTNACEYNPVGKYIDNEVVIRSVIGTIQTGEYASRPTIQEFTKDTECYIKIDGLDDKAPNVILYASGYQNLGTIKGVSGEYKKVLIPSGTMQVSITLGEDNPLEDTRKYRLTIASRLNDYDEINIINKKLSTCIDLPYPPMQAEAQSLGKYEGTITAGNYEDIVDIKTATEDIACWISVKGFTQALSVSFLTSGGSVIDTVSIPDQFMYKVTIPATTAKIKVALLNGVTVVNDTDFCVFMNTDNLGDSAFFYRDFKVSDIYSIYDGAMSKFPNYITKEVLGRDSSDTYDINGYVVNFCKNKPKYTILVVCNIHGGSASGDPVMGAYISTKLIRDLIGSNSHYNKTLNWIKENVKLCIIPAANPWGIDNYSRTNYKGVNIGRNFPVSDWADIPEEAGTDNYKGASAGDQIETQIIISYISSNTPDAVIDNHTLGGFDGIVDSNSGHFYVSFVKDQSILLYNEYFTKFGYYAMRDYGLQIQMPSTFYAKGSLRDWVGENNYLGGLIEMQWRDLFEYERGFTARIIEFSYFQLLSVFDYYRLLLF